MSCAGQATLAEPVETGAVAVADDLEQVIRAHARFVFGVAWSVLRHREDAEDAVQETFLRLMRQDLRKIEDPRLWLARVAWRVAVDRVRKRPEQSLDDAAAQVEQLAAAGAAADERVLEDQLKTLLERLVERLPGGLRDVVRLSTAEEMTSHDIAEVLKIPEASVRTRLFRARQLLREKMLTAMEKKS
jgi:RNA polymerase sigma-70 factor (ECF subfamily)